MRSRRLLLPLATLAVALVLRPLPAAENASVTLPPFVVEEPAQPLPWRYARLGELEILSCCPDPLTRALVANHLRLHALLAELVPPHLQLTLSGPNTLLFVDAARQPPTSQEVVAHMALSAVDQQALDQASVPLDDGRLRRRAPPPRYTFLPNLRLWDRDAQTLFAVVDERQFQPNRVGLTPDYVAYILRQRLPALPPWFVSGVLALHARATFSEDALTLDRLDWPADASGAALLGAPQANRALLPLADFFAGDLTATDTAAGEELSLWRTQAALLVHWGLAGRDAPRRPALWQFVARAATEPVTETLFRECFGLDFAAAHRALTAHLPEAMRTRLALRPTLRAPSAELALRPATDVEVSRLKGDWERLEIAFVKAQFPALAGKYAEQARRSLRRAYDAGSRDHQLLTSLGLCEIDAGNDPAALAFLEDAAARSADLRPRAWFELARLRFAALRSSASGSPAALTRAQAAAILEPLAAARRLSPPLVESYVLLADTLAAAAEAPAPDQFAALEAGVRLFPRHPELVARAAELALRHARPDTARWLTDLGLTLAPDATARARFETLRARLPDRAPAAP
jgi:hypothetical protein